MLSLILVFLGHKSSWAIEKNDKFWTKVLDKNGIIIFSGEKKEKGIIPFKAKAVIAADVLSVVNVLRDFDNKHLWAPKLKSVKTHQVISENEYIFSEYYKTPWPATDREFLLKGTLREKNGKYFIDAYSFKNELYADKAHIQADVKTLNIVLEKGLNDTTKVSFEFYGDLKGWLPIWLINLIQKKWPYKFIKELEKRIKYLKQNKG